MKLNIHIRQVSALLVGIVLLTTLSCEKKEPLSTAVELLSFGPSGVSHGEQIRFIGNNLDKVTAIDLVGASIPSNAFIEHTSEQIIITVPIEAEHGPVTLKTPAGDIVSKSPLNLNVPVEITSMTETVKPGETVSIQGEYLNWISAVTFEGGAVVTTFESQSRTELVVRVPLEAQTGLLIFSCGGTEPIELESETELAVTLPALTGLSPNPIERGKTLTINGTDLDLVNQVWLKGVAEPITDFSNQSEQQLTLTVPEEATRGTVDIVTFSGITISSTDILSFVGDPAPLDPLAFPLFVDKLENNAQNWGWGSTVDLNNTENVRDGDAAIKVSYQGSWGALKFANFSVNAAGYTELSFAIYATPETDGQKINVSVNGGTTNVITLEAGKWVEYKLSMSELGDPATITEITMQETGWSGSVFIDHVGLR
ncbi:hypothetical protein GCM10011386_20140 [Parapedobacter defluvii]|uniref:IPT/TIG domain-containing protein n=1 Tax=Parapedobacter defluvii TaxID=2045106 RepID=A0ABQ1LTU6_9SPHI|nr:IPT/TIG domain-containing protein [Parapedobacter defluvii]GGC28076.1 hypothetical protein GCM10011386_20140 [Parapedobacter defluvii]